MEQCPGIDSVKNEFLQKFNTIAQDDKTNFIIDKINSILLPEESSILNSNDRLLILDFIMDQCLLNVSSLEFGNKDFSFAKIIEPILENFDSIPEIALKLFQKALSLSPHLIVDHPTLLENIFLKIFQPNQNVINVHEQLISLKKDLLMTFLKLSVNTNNFPLFHQWYFKSLAKVCPREKLLDVEFYRFYSMKIYESHFATVIEIWQLFLKCFDSENNHQMTLFAIFLSHVQISPDSSSKYGDLVNSTEKVLANTTSCTKCPDSLQIYYPLAFFKSLPNHTVENLDDDEPNLKLYNLSHVFPETDVEYWREFYERFDNLDRYGREVFAKMMIFNYKILKISFQNDSIDCTKLLHEVWIKIFDQNQYSSFDYIEFLIIELDGHHKSLLKMSNFLIENLLDDETSYHQNVRKILCSDRIWESRNFQNVFISVILKNISEIFKISTPNVVKLTQDEFWQKHADEMPDTSGNNEKHREMIYLFQQEIAISESREVRNVTSETWPSIQKLLQIFVDYVPIEYISPFNQIRCVLIFQKIINKMDFSMKVDIVDLWIRANLRLWNTIRRIWFFDFISPSVYIYRIIPIYYSNFESTIYNGDQLLESCIIALFKLNDPERIFRSVEELIHMAKTEKNLLSYREFVIKIFGVMLKHMLSYGKRSKNLARQEQVKSMDNLLVILVEFLYDNLRTYLKLNDCLKKLSSRSIIEALFELSNDEISDKIPDNRTKWKEVYRKMLQMFNEDFNILLGDNPSFRQFLKFSLENRPKLEDVLPDDFIQNLWSTIIQNFAEKGDSKFQEKIQSKTYWKRTFKCEENWKEIQDLVADFAPKSNDNPKFDKCINSIANILISIIDFTTAEEYAMIMDSCLDHCIKQDLAQATFFIFVLSKMVQSTNMSREKALVLNERFTEIFSLSLLLLFLSNKQQSIQQNLENVAFIKVKVLELCRYGSNQLIAQGLYSKVYLFSLFNVCCEVNILNCNTIESYCTVFMQTNSILSDLLVKQSSLMANSMSSAMDIIITLMASLIRMSHENNLINATDYEKLQLENCSKTFQRTIAKLTNVDEFRPFAFHLIAHYLEHSLDGIAVVALVKQNLITTMFNLIDMIVKHDSKKMELFYTKLNPKSKVLFKKLVEHHDQYYRFKGYV